MSTVGSSAVPRRLTVVMPARNEAATIEPALAALADQRDAPCTLDIIIVANDCSDATAAVARAVAQRLPVAVDVIERRFSPQHAHVGAARRFGLDLAAARLRQAGHDDGWIASTDADTRVASDWLAATCREAARADAVAGHVTLGTDDRARLLAPVRVRYARERTYRRLLATLEGLMDPLPHDPLPRHASFVGASFAVAVHAYEAAGGLPALAALEDLAMARALQRIDKRIRYSLDVRAETSARTEARVHGGFGTFLASLAACAEAGTSATVEEPVVSARQFAQRAAIRAWRAAGATTPLPATLATLPPRTIRDIACAPADGIACEVAAAERAHLAPPAQVAVDIAIARLRTLIAFATALPKLEGTGA